MLEFLDANRCQHRYDRILCLLFRHTSAVLPSVHPKDEKPITDIAAAPTTAPQIAGFRLGYFFINGALVSGDLPLIFPPPIAALRENSSATR